MTWSYSSALTTNVDKVRWLCGDRDTNDQLIENEEITFALSESGNNLYRAAAMACRAIAAKLFNSLTLDKAPGSVSYDAAERAQGFLDLAAELETKATMSGSAAGIFAGGISISDKQTREDDTDRVRPGFTSDLHRNRPLLNPTNPVIETDW